MKMMKLLMGIMVALMLVGAADATTAAGNRFYAGDVGFDFNPAGPAVPVSSVSGGVSATAFTSLEAKLALLQGQVRASGSTLDQDSVALRASTDVISASVAVLSGKMDTLNAQQALIYWSLTVHGDLRYTTGTMSATTCAGGGAFLIRGRAMTASFVVATAFGSTIFVDVSNAEACPAVTDANSWSNLAAYNTTQPTGGASGQVPGNFLYITGWTWVKFRIEVTPQSAATINLQSQN